MKYHEIEKKMKVAKPKKDTFVFGSHDRCVVCKRLLLDKRVVDTTSPFVVCFCSDKCQKRYWGNSVVLDNEFEVCCKRCGTPVEIEEDEGYYKLRCEVETCDNGCYIVDIVRETAIKDWNEENAP